MESVFNSALGFYEEFYTLPGGQMGILYSYGADPIAPIAVFPREDLPPERTPLGRALDANGLVWRAIDLTAGDLKHALLKHEVLEALRPEFEREGNMALHDGRMGEALGVAAAIEAGAHRRYLYHVRTPAEER